MRTLKKLLIIYWGKNVLYEVWLKNNWLSRITRCFRTVDTSFSYPVIVIWMQDVLVSFGSNDAWILHETGNIFGENSIKTKIQSLSKKKKYYNVNPKSRWCSLFFPVSIKLSTWNFYFKVKESTMSTIKD